MERKMKKTSAKMGIKLKKNNDENHFWALHFCVTNDNKKQKIMLEGNIKQRQISLLVIYDWYRRCTELYQNTCRLYLTNVLAS